MKGWAAFAMMLLFGGSVSAEIYMYKDASGALCFTDSPSATHIDKLGARPIDKKRSKIKRSSAYDAIILRASRKHNISFSLIKAVIHAESGFNPKALSSKGAMGLMQLMPGNSTYMKIKNPYDPYENIMGGCTYLRKLLTLYKGDTRLALAAYNAGPSKVKQFGGVPPYPETKAYIAKVVRYKKIYTVSK